MTRLLGLAKAASNLRLAAVRAICVGLFAGAAPGHAQDGGFVSQESAPALLDAEIESEARSMPFSRGRLFKVTSRSGKTSYLLGSLHSADDRVSQLSPRILDALTSSRLLVLEISESEPASEKLDLHALREALRAPSDRQAARLLPLEDYVLLVNRLGACEVLGLPVESLKASAIAITIDARNCGAGKARSREFLDATLARLAGKNNIPVIGLETLIEQLDVADGLPKEVDRELLETTLRRAPYEAEIEETEIQLYLEGDIGKLLAWMKSAQPVPRLTWARWPSKFIDRLITTRNHRMSGRAAPLLENGSAFIAIGAAHIPGPDGVAQLLENRGFQLEVVE